MGVHMEDRDEIQRQARARAQRIAERFQAESDSSLGDATAGAQALDWLRVSLEALAHGYGFLAEMVDKPELTVLIRDRLDLEDIMRVTRAGKVLQAKLDGEHAASFKTDNKEKMLDHVIEQLARRSQAAARRVSRPMQMHAVTGSKR